jgi:hypothetical protein
MRDTPPHGIRVFTGARFRALEEAGCILRAQTTSTCSTATAFHFRHRSAADSKNARLVRRLIYLHEQAHG